MLDRDTDLTPQVNFAIDVMGLATRYDFTVMRWGTHVGASCTVNPDLASQHDQWLGVDLELSDTANVDQFKTDAVIAGLYVSQRGPYIHLQPTPIEKVV